MKAAVHQPQYFPYPGFFHKLSLVDIFVVMDHTQYDKRFTNRNKIMATAGPIWITVPINKEHKFFPNNQVKINNDIKWASDHWNKIFHSYKRSPHFDIFEKEFEEIFQTYWHMLSELNITSLKKIINFLGLDVKVILESELNIEGTNTQRLINLCKAVEADTYVSGIGGKSYMDEKLFQTNNMQLEFQNYIPQPYKQRFTETFVPNLSIIDMICSLGFDTMDFITKQPNN